MKSPAIDGRSYNLVEVLNDRKRRAVLAKSLQNRIFCDIYRAELSYPYNMTFFYSELKAPARRTYCAIIFRKH